MSKKQTTFAIISPEVVVVAAAIHVEGAAWDHVASSFFQRLPTVELVWRYTLNLKENTGSAVVKCLRCRKIGRMKLVDVVSRKA